MTVKNLAGLLRDFIGKNGGFDENEKNSFGPETPCKSIDLMVRPAGFEPAAY